MKKKLIISSLVAAFLIGCGGSDSSSSDSNSTKSGTYEDAPVAGLAYKTTSGITGITDENGTFKYKDGDKVTFKVGNVVLGTIEGKKVVTPYDSGIEVAKKVAYLLQNLDTDGNASNNVIKLPNKDVLENYFTSGLVNDLNVTEIKKIKTNIEKNLSKNLAEVNETQALQNLQNYIIDKNVTKDKLIQDVLKNGLLGLKNKELYGVNNDNDQFSEIESFDVNYTDDSYKYIDLDTGETGEIKPLEWNKTNILEPVDDEGDQNLFTLLKVDVANNLVFVKHNYGIIALFSSKEARDNYKKKLETEYTKTPIDPKTLKGEYLYRLDNNIYQWLAIKLADNNLSIYNVDDITDDLYDESNYRFDKYKKLEYLGGNKIKIEDDNNTYKNEDVYKISLANREMSVFGISKAFDSDGRFENLFKRFGIDSIEFKKGNAYCDLLWEECWFDRDAMAEINAKGESIAWMYATPKGKAKAPKYSKLSDYLKEKDYYVVYTEHDYMDYERDYIEGDEIVFEDIGNLTNNPSKNSIPMSDYDNVSKVIAEYDNGFLIEVHRDGMTFKRFFYDNEKDAKAEFDKLLPKYHKVLPEWED